jgi:sugar O-acyltransferase (sialic acid O-acetyltransferase NeuD family)
MLKALIGAGGHAREVIAQMGIDIPMFVDDKYVDDSSKPLSTLDYDKYQVLIAIADPIVKKKIIEKIPSYVKFFSFIHPTALILDKKTIKIGEGAFIGAYSILTTNIKIGNHCLLNRSNHIGHDCNIGNYLSMMPGAIISGNCKIGDCFYMGSNSTIRENISIKDNIKIGMNSCLTKNIDTEGIYVGVPSKKIK